MTVTIYYDNVDFFDALKTFASKWKGVQIENEEVQLKSEVVKAITDTVEHKNIFGTFDTPKEAVTAALVDL